MEISWFRAVKKGENMNRYEKSQLESKNQNDYVRNLQREQRFDPAKSIYNPLYSAPDKIKREVNENTNSRRK